MANAYKPAAEALKAILDAISSSTLALKFQYLESMPSSFPAAFITIDKSPGERFVDTVHNEVTPMFNVMAIFPSEESSGAFLKWMSLLDALTAAFRSSSNLTLGGIAVSFRIESTEQFSDQNNYAQPIVGFSVRVSAKMLLSI